MIHKINLVDFYTQCILNITTILPLRILMGNMFWLERKFHIVLRINFNLQMDSQHNNASSILQQYYPFRTLI